MLLTKRGLTKIEHIVCGLILSGGIQPVCTGSLKPLPVKSLSSANWLVK